MHRLYVHDRCPGACNHPGETILIGPVMEDISAGVVIWPGAATCRDTGVELVLVREDRS